MLTSTSSPASLPEGYVANERIGSGGYGEVWRATAPGGVEKAVKIVYGHCDDELAERELRSLERIRSVRHPFVISLERFEVLEGRLIIVTELADMSLDACYQQHKSAGLPGIPRNELIGYIRDAAEALDCLVEHHSLQHLDVKPENLLVVGDHVKVGDFGLVKELASRTLVSLIGGMTPLYSAPEVFDDAPSPRSDQYSLAIVYQQMLTGQLPFPGRTPAQLAKQHTQAEPILQALSKHDREVVAKALAKRPEDRFDSCIDFVTALTKTSTTVVSRPVAVAPASGDVTEEASEETTSSGSLATESTPVAVDQPIEMEVEQEQEEQDELFLKPADTEFVEVGLPEINVEHSTALPTLVIGVGGLGVAMLSSTRSVVAGANAGESDAFPVNYLAIDTDRESLKTAASDTVDGPCLGTEYLHIPLRLPKEYGDRSNELLGWVSRRWLYNIPRSLETRGYRPLGRIAAVDHAGKILECIYSKLYELLQVAKEARKLRVVVLAGSGGGTGSGIAIDIAQAARSMSGDLGVAIEVDGMIGLPERAAGNAESLPTVNSYALLTEVMHAQQFGNVGDSPARGPTSRYEAASAPFDALYWIPIPPRHYRSGYQRVYRSIGVQVLQQATNKQATAVFNACTQLNRSLGVRFQSIALTESQLAEHPIEADKYLTLHLGCAYQRVLVALCRQHTERVKDLEQQLPGLNIVETGTPREALAYIAMGIDPGDVATSLAKFYPDVAEAAQRLLTRSDIQWQAVSRGAEASLAPSGALAACSPEVAEMPTLQRAASH